MLKRSFFDGGEFDVVAKILRSHQLQALGGTPLGVAGNAQAYHPEAKAQRFSGDGFARVNVQQSDQVRSGDDGFCVPACNQKLVLKIDFEGVSAGKARFLTNFIYPKI